MEKNQKENETKTTFKINLQRVKNENIAKGIHGVYKTIHGWMAK